MRTWYLMHLAKYCLTLDTPQFSEWCPPDHIVLYLQVWLRKPHEREVRNCFRAECQRPTIPGKVPVTPEFDSFMVTYMAAKGRDPPRGSKRVCAPRRIND